MKRAEGEEPRGKRYYGIVQLLATGTAALTVTVLLVLFYSSNINKVNEPIHTQIPDPASTMQPILYADEQWKVSREEFDKYTNFVKNKSDALLTGMQPMNVFKWYVTASRLGDHETLYALLNIGTDTSTPSKEEYLSDIAKDQAGTERPKQLWESYMSEYRLDQTIEGDYATIVLIPVNKANSGENRKYFGLTRNSEGIWQANWMAMQ